MISFPEAIERLLSNVALLPAGPCRVEKAAGRVLRGEVRADRAFPPFDRVMMDGFALRVADWEAGRRKFSVCGSAPAGVARVGLPEGGGACVEVMTGAPCPRGADGIVPVEEVAGRDADGVVFKESAAPVAGRFLHRAGSDAARGEVLLESGRLLGSREIGVAASCGAAWLEVSDLPRIAVMATGDELVAVEEVPEEHQIRQSNAHSLAAALERAGYPAGVTGVIGDDEAEARLRVESLLAGNDWLVFAGAVSKGGRDFLPNVLQALGCRELFHGVRQRPGKPVGCWIGPAGQVVMALPGNPVSALTGLHVMVLPALAVASGLELPPPRRMVPAEPVRGLREFTWHLPVKLRADGRVEPANTGNSGDFIGLLRSDGCLTLPPAGDAAMAFPFTPWL